MLHLDRPEGGEGKEHKNFVSQGKYGFPVFELTRKNTVTN